ncbi:Myosin-2 heavy chain like [Quillaja saponaria]|uniref:Myosin-2 heavy chain like n=1 Tax=Quillaja saponaria TaxID=32244 RepID=A0AAD7PXD2_QUISA|nr:Myosin-2 heavy chain like [Quillaja saponaria]
MEEESQKLVALKKAYADMILNTAKEAAARIMASERKALCFQHDLSSTKEEALRMLDRLKKMIDSKTTEAEMTSLSQQRNLQQLEAQLHEAEDVVIDLRMELKQVWHKLEMVKNSQVQPFKGQTAMRVASSQKDAILEPIISSPHLYLESLANSDVKNAALNKRSSDSTCCNATKQNEQSSVSRLENYYAHDPDFASILMRRKEPELCRNGCTQRTLAFERDLLEGKLPTVNADDQHVALKNELIVKASDKEDEKCGLHSSGTKNKQINENLSMEGIKKPVRLCRKQKRKTAASYWSSFLSCSDTYKIGENTKFAKDPCIQRSISRYFINKVKRRKICRTTTCKQPPVLKHCLSIGHNVKTSEDCLKINEANAKITPSPHLEILESDDNMKPLHHLDPGALSIKDDNHTLSGSTRDTMTVNAVKTSALVQKAIENDRELSDKSLLRNLEGTNAENLIVPGCNLELEVVDEPLNTGMEDAETFEENNKSPSQGEDSKLLRYTFRRKRRKESLTNTDQKTSDEKKTLEGMVDEKQNGSPKPQKSSLINESSRDNQSLAQVARRLISLSGKRW